ncbi:MAG TPA: tRNA (adenosine(37)-N6)-threonylcarbamoyltransferase complex ATPase subunit type 1 TsaE [Microlunatus sp.]
MNISVADLVVSVATAADAPGMVDVIHAAFGARPPLDPPSTANAETPASIEAQLAAGGGIYATVDGEPAGAILLHPVADRPGLVSWHRVSVHPSFQRHGIATAMVDAALDYAAELGFGQAELFAREEITELIAFWQHRGFVVDRPERNGVVLARTLPLAVDVPTAEQMQDLGVRLAGVLQAGDLVIASGDLGAGKTTLTQGIGRGLDTEGAVISPTFVLSRIHPSRSQRPGLVHVDAYRLTGADELDDLDLDATAGDHITVVEWGAGLAEGLADHRLEIDIRRSAYPSGGVEHPDSRLVIIRPVGRRWSDVDLRVLQSGRDRD